MLHFCIARHAGPRKRILLQVPAKYAAPYAGKAWSNKRKTYAGMLSAADEALGNVTRALRARGFWDDTVLVATTDNGGPTETCAVQPTPTIHCNRARSKGRREKKSGQTSFGIHTS